MTRLALTGARLIDGNGPAVDRATVVIDGDRIAEVSSGSPPEDVDTVIDLAGRTVMPGMFTCHFHSTYHELGSKPNTPYGDEYPPSYLALIAAKNLKAALDSGFTGVVGAGGSHDVEGECGRPSRMGSLSGPVSGPHPGSCRRRATAMTACRGIGECRPLGRCTSVMVPTASAWRSRGSQAGRPGDQAVRDRRARHDCAEGPYRNDPRRVGRRD